MEEGSSAENFEFAFNDADFSDRVLHIQITPDEDFSTPKLKKLKYSLIDSPPPTQTDVSDCCAEFQLKSLHLSSVILAAKSPFFYKLFKNGMSESQQKEATLRIHSSEETALMDLLKFMYTNTLAATTCSDLVDVLMAADKFEVKSCIKHCIQLLLQMPISLQSALSFLDIPSTVLAAKPLIDASKESLVEHFTNLHTCKVGILKLPLAALEIVLSSESLQVLSEDEVYKFILEWARTHYPKLKERQEILNKQLVKFISFTYMSFPMLKEALVCPDLTEQVSKLVMEAVFQKAEASSDYFTTTKTRRKYYNRPVKVVPVEFSLPRFIVYFNLKKEDCRTLVPEKNNIYTEDFRVGRQLLYFAVACSNLEGSSPQNFLINIHGDKGAGTYSSTLDVEFAVMGKRSSEYEVRNKEWGLVLSEQEEEDGWNLFESPWTTFMSDGSKYFVDDVLHVRVQITVIKSSP